MTDGAADGSTPDETRGEKSPWGDSETAATDSYRLRVGLAIASIGVVFAALFGILALVGPPVFISGYPLGIGLALAGLALTAIVGSRLQTVRYGESIVAVVVGVLLVGSGLEAGELLETAVGVLCVVVGVVLVSRLDKDTRD
ncbi:hypothetical protein [Haloarcula marismortui]|nr:hypothetical protein [Haloarcula sinaiiensis]QUJ73869.1 hypothetical protein KDQ40_17940 [Haloarcula sinaiiensis ATCC 33800]